MTFNSNEHIKSRVSKLDIEKLKDPVYAAIVLGGHGWLADAKAEKHRAFLRDDSLKIIVVCGRGWGKSLTTALKAVFCFLLRIKKVSVLIASSSQRQSMQMFEYVENCFLNNPSLRRLIERKTRTLIKLKPPFGGKIEALPCSKNKMRGKHPDALLVDEASVIPAEILTSELRMMLTKKKTWLIMLGTPLGFDHPFRIAAHSPDFKQYHAASYESPLVGEEQVEQWKKELESGLMTKDEWIREVEAKWCETEKALLPLDLINSAIDPDADLYVAESDSDLESAPRSHLNVFGGLDLGREKDFSVLYVLYRDGNILRPLYLRQFQLKTPYSAVVAHTIRAHQIFKFARLCVDSSGVGAAPTEDLENALLPDEPIEAINLSSGPLKAKVWGLLKLRFEQKRIKISDYKPLISQLSEQQAEYLKPKTARETVQMRFFHPPNRHDDVFCALALAIYAAREEEIIEEKPKGVFRPL